MKQALLSAVRTALLLCSAFAAAPAFAQTEESTEEAPAISIDASVEVVSDYRFRGISLSDFDPAVQPSLTVTHKSGFYANAWGSNITEYGGADVEVDFTLGWSGDIGGGTSADVYAMYYLYPGASGLHYAEFGAILSQSVGEGSVAAEVSYSPAQQGTGDVDNIYLGLSGELPVKDTPLTLRGSFGYEDGAWGTNKLDWMVGAEFNLGKGFAAGINYVDSYRSQLREGRAGVVANLRFEF
jgi:uncharacterized protein (TIGR02001 family)